MLLFAGARHRPELVRLRTMLTNQLHFLAMSQVLCRKQKLSAKKGRRNSGVLRMISGQPANPLR
jgi:hypothetical protein